MTIKKTFCILLVQLTLLFGANMAYSADSTLYNNQANQICQMLNSSLLLYQNNQFKRAYALSEKSYWYGYNSTMKTEYRPYTSPKNLLSIEDEFHAISHLIKTPITQKNEKQLIQKVHDLCKELHQQAKTITEEGG